MFKDESMVDEVTWFGRLVKGLFDDNIFDDREVAGVRFFRGIRIVGLITKMDLTMLELIELGLGLQGLKAATWRQDGELGMIEEMKDVGVYSFVF